MSKHISVVALIIAIIALFNSYDADAKGTKGSHRAHAKGHKTHSQRSHVHKKSTPTKVDNHAPPKPEPQVVNNYYGSSGNASSSIMPMVAGAALGYTASSMLNNSDKGSEKDSDESKSNVHPQERLND